MRNLLPVLAMLTAAAAAAPAASRRPAQTLDARLAGFTPGPARQCFDRSLPVRTEAYGDVILYEVSRKLVYRVDTAGGCEGVSRGDILVTKAISGRLCSGDTAQTVRQTGRVVTGSCTLRGFTPYRR